MANIEKQNKGIRKLSQDEFLKEFNIENCLEIFNKVNTCISAFNTKTLTLASVNKEYSKKFVLAYIKMWIINLNDFLNIQRKMIPEQITETSMLIYNEFYYFNIADINLIFIRIKTGYYGKFYESIDGMKIIDFFFNYANERAKNISNDIDNKDSKYKIDDYKRSSDITDIKTAIDKAKGFEQFRKNNIELPDNV